MRSRHYAADPRMTASHDVVAPNITEGLFCIIPNGWHTVCQAATGVWWYYVNHRLDATVI